MKTSQAESDLEWFYYQSESQMGINSSFESIRYAILSHNASSRTSMPDSVTEERLEATHRHRQIHQRLTRITPTRHLAILNSAYQTRSWTKVETDAFSTAIGVTIHSPSAQRYYAEDSKQAPDDGFWIWIAGVAARNETERIQQIRLEASDLLRAAVAAYSKADT